MQDLNIKKIYASIGGYFGYSFSLEFKDGVFNYDKSEISKHEIFLTDTFEVDTDILFKFYSDLKKLKHWNKEYWEDACDGTQWEVEIIMNDIKIKSRGSNSYPRDFNIFKRAVRKLIGGREFD